MKSHRIIPAIALVLSMVTITGPDSSAQERLPDGSVVQFVVPSGIAVGTLSTLVFTGPADGTVVGPGDCGTGGPLQSTVVINGPAGSRSFSVNVIVLEVNVVANPPAVPPGTRVGSLVQNGPCNGGAYDKWTGVVE